MRKESQPDSASINMPDLRQRHGLAQGPAYWRSLEELSGTPEFREAVEREFPALMEQWGDSISRRGMLKVMGASLALLGLSGCFYKRPQEKIVPYPQAPEETVTGRPLYFATAMPFNGYARGVLALSREGRPIKIEGNPTHPASLGATDVFMQASILGLYDPDRSRTVMHSGRTATWGDALSVLNARLGAKRKDGSGVRILTGTVTSPTLLAQLNEFAKRYPGATWHQYDPIETPDGGADSGIFQSPVDVIYDLTHADVIVALGSDFMFEDRGSLRYARQFADGRRVRAGQLKMNRLYVVESMVTITGSMADHRLPIAPSRIEMVTRALAAKLKAQTALADTEPALTASETAWIDAVSADLSRSAGRGVLIAGRDQPPPVQALVHAMNQSLGNIGKSVNHIDRVAGEGKPLKDLVEDMRAGRVDTLLILGGNPCYDAPVDLQFTQALDEMSRQQRQNDYVNLTLHLGCYYDETSFHCQWHIPCSHYLESWGDIRAFDGTASIIQPLIAPMYGSKTEWELLETLLGRPYRLGVEIIKGHWANQSGGDFEKWWMESLQNGVIAQTAAKHRHPPALRTDITPAKATGNSGIEVLFKPDPSAWDGAFTNNSWLQELPKPFIKLTWDNAIIINVRMAEHLGGSGGMLRDGQVVRIEYGGRTIEGPVIILPGQPDGMITLTLGYGRTQGGSLLHDEESSRGYNAYLLRTSKAPWMGQGATIAVLDRMLPLAITRNHHAMSAEPGAPGIKSSLKPETIAHPGLSDMDLEVNNRLIIRTATLEQFRANRNVIKELDPSSKKPLLSLYPGWDYQHGLQWGMNIDQTTCIGCNACVIACQAENNIPVVGKTEVMRQREMHWIRIDDYFSGPVDSPKVFHQPVPCMHCENAPCEYVCPVGATTHSDEGLNEMTYNRCIGTRYCSNNCPYKVRRFNFLLYSDFETPSLRLLHNPDVTVRSRGVMEKCTYCLQRINNTRVEMETQTLQMREAANKVTDPGQRVKLLKQAEERGREIVRNLQTACQQACPTRAIVFGDIRDPQSEVTVLKKQPADYSLLTELTTKPRTSYLACFTNPNADLQKGVQS